MYVICIIRGIYVIYVIHIIYFICVSYICMKMDLLLATISLYIYGYELVRLSNSFIDLASYLVFDGW